MRIWQLNMDQRTMLGVMVHVQLPKQRSPAARCLEAIRHIQYDSCAGCYVAVVLCNGVLVFFKKVMSDELTR